MPKSKTVPGIKVTWGATHRNGLCEKCHIPIEDVPTGRYIGGTLYRLRTPATVRYCPKCGGDRGTLISRQMTIEPPESPECIHLSCLVRYLLDSFKYALVALYHQRRTAYAEANRDGDILERYRTGEPSPETIWQAIHANIKLTCPVCRKYNVDPLLKFPR